MNFLRIHQDALGIFIFALLIRSIFVFQWQSTPYAELPFLDAKAYADWAIAISRGDLSRPTAFYQSPLYPYLLGLAFKLFGNSLALIGYFQAALSAATCALLTKYTSRMYSRSAGIFTGLLSSLCLTMIFFCAPLLKETLSLFVISLFLVAQSSSRPALTGLALGLTALTRSNLVLLAVGSLVLFWRQSVKHGLATFLIAFICILMPSAFHNYLKSGELIVISYAGGFNFYIGHWEGATGANAYPPFVSTDPLQEEADTTRIASKELGHLASPSEVSSFWFDKGLRFAANHVAQEAYLLINKIARLLNTYEIPDNYDIHFFRSNFSTVISLPLVDFGFVFAFATIGALCTYRQSQTRNLLLFLALCCLSIIPFYVTDRYRLPLIPFLLPLAGQGLLFLYTCLTHGKFKVLIPSLATGLAAIALTYYPLETHRRDLDAYGWGFLAGQYSDLGRDQEALSALERGLMINSKAISARALIKSATSYERLGQIENAKALLIKAVTWYPEDGLTHHNLARFYLDQGNNSAAEPLFKKSIEVSPWLHQPYIGLAVMALNSGDKTNAREWAKRGLAIHAESPELQEILRRTQ